MQNLQTAHHFIGRDNELNLFKKWLVDDQAPHVLYFHDAVKEQDKKGGIGKTWLLRQCQEIVQQEHPELAVTSIDFFNVGDRNGVVVAERIVEALRATFSDWIPTSFLEAIAEYRDVNKPEGVEATEARSALFKALTTDLQYLDHQLINKQKALIVFYDTYELIEQNPLVATLRFSQRFPNTYEFRHIYAVIAGRNALDWTHSNWKGREQEVQVVPITPFSPEEMVEYIKVEAGYNIDTRSEQTEALYIRTEGRPILIGLATDILNKHIVTLEHLATVPLHDFEAHLVQQINNLEHPLNWIVLFMAHAYHRFNRDILNWILQEANLKHLVQDIQYDELIKNLPTLSFVRKPGSGDDFVLHDEMRRLVNRYCWPTHDKDFRYRIAISNNIIEYYKYAMDQEPDQQKRQNYRLEVLFHRLFLDVNDGLEYFKEHFYSAIDRWQSPFARTFLQEALQFKDKMSSDQLNLLKLDEGRLLRAEDNPIEALDIYQTLERQADEQWTCKHRLDLLHGKGRCYLALSRFFEAIDSFEQCLKIEEAVDDFQETAKNKETAIANRLGQLGYVYRRRGQFDMAIKYYEKSIAIHKRLNNQREYANILNNIGNVYKLQGKLDEALLRCKIALRMRTDLFKADRIGEVPVGLSNSTIGLIYLAMDDISNAEKSFQQAYEIYNRARDRRSIAGTLNRFGQIALARSDWQEAKQCFKQAQEASAHIDSEAYLISLNQQGHILAKQGQWAEAATFFEQAVDLARKVHDDFQRTENLVNLAEALEYMHQQQKALEVLQEAEQLSYKWNYSHLLGHAAEFQGDVDYKSGRYEEAFAHYQVYCYHMAQRNTFEYGKARRKLVDLLVGIPADQLHLIIDSLVAYWYREKMDEKYPDFIDTCKEVAISL